MAKLKTVNIIAAGVLCASLAGVVYAQTAEELVAKRRAEMIVIGKANGGIGAVGRMPAATPDQINAIKGEADKIVAAFDTVKDPAMWAKGSGVGDGIAGTKAKAEIWTDPAGFKAAMDASIAAAHALKAATDSGDIAKVKTGQAALQGTCGGCHSKFRT